MNVVLERSNHGIFLCVGLGAVVGKQLDSFQHLPLLTRHEIPAAAWKETVYMFVRVCCNYVWAHMIQGEMHKSKFRVPITMQSACHHKSRKTRGPEWCNLWNAERRQEEGNRQKRRRRRRRRRDHWDFLMTFAFFGNVLMMPYSNFLSERQPWCLAQWCVGQLSGAQCVFILLPWFHSLQSQKPSHS